MDCSWTHAVRSAGFEFVRPESGRFLAFVYTATVGLQVEESCVNVNPTLSLRDLRQILTNRPAWLNGRPKWLKTAWPNKQVESRRDLELYALTASKALLAVGAQIPDGTRVEMLRAMADLFPKAESAIGRDLLTYQAWSAHVTIEGNRHMEWGYGGAPVREGHTLFIPETDLGGRSAFEVFLQNQLRIDIQQRIESTLT